MILIVTGIYWLNDPGPFLLYSLIHFFCFIGFRFLLWRSRFFLFLFTFSCTIFYFSVIDLLFYSVICSFIFFLLLLPTRCIFQLLLLCLFWWPRWKFIQLILRSSSLKMITQMYCIWKIYNSTVELPSFPRGFALDEGVLTIAFGFVSLMSFFFEGGGLQNQRLIRK